MDIILILNKTKKETRLISIDVIGNKNKSSVQNQLKFKALEEGTFYARDLFQSGREITPMFKLVMVCNEPPPQLPNSDKATWNRIRVIPFEATFSFDAPPF